MESSLEDRLQYHFKDSSLLKLALTHPSHAYDSKHRLQNNQRLEFLGDAVLQLTLSDSLFHLFPNEAEGFLTKMRTRLVQTATLARIARSINLGTELIMSRGEEINGGRERENILADATEAVLGAVYLDAGYQAVLKVIQTLWQKEMDAVRQAPGELNPKGQLQEILQDHGGITPTYRIISSEGPDHQKSFSAVVTWNGKDLGQGTGRSKKEAEIEAARAALLSPLLPNPIRTNI